MKVGSFEVLIKYFDFRNLPLLNRTSQHKYVPKILLPKGSYDSLSKKLPISSFPKHLFPSLKIQALLCASNGHLLSQDIPGKMKKQQPSKTLSTATQEWFGEWGSRSKSLQGLSHFVATIGKESRRQEFMCKGSIWEVEEMLVEGQGREWSSRQTIKDT